MSSVSGGGDETKQQSQSTSKASKSLVPDSIKVSLLDHRKLTLSLYQKKDVIGHTGIALKFDGTPKFTIDYGTAEEKKEEGKGDDAAQAEEVKDDASGADSDTSSSSGQESCDVNETPRYLFSTASGVEANQWDAGNMKLLCDLMTISLKNKERKALKLIDRLLKLNIGEYNVVMRNCRDWCIQAGDFIAEKFQVSEGNMEEFKSWIASIKLRDPARAVQIAVDKVAGDDSKSTSKSSSN